MSRHKIPLNGQESLPFMEQRHEKFPAAPDNRETIPGTLWKIGRHKLLCGDTGISADIDYLLSGDTVGMIHTDPPYNVKVQSRSKKMIAKGVSDYTSKSQRDSSYDDDEIIAKERTIADDELSDDEFNKKLKSWFSNLANVLPPGHAIYLWGGFSNLEKFPLFMRDVGIHYSQPILWIKQHPLVNRYDFMSNHELGFYGWKKGGKHRFFGGKNIPDTWFVKKLHHKYMVHLTEKPVELVIKAIQCSSLGGEVVLDGFAGSGSTLFACEETNRVARLIEYDPWYCDVIVTRARKYQLEVEKIEPCI